MLDYKLVNDMTDEEVKKYVEDYTASSTWNAYVDTKNYQLNKRNTKAVKN